MRYPIAFKYRFELLLPLMDNQGNEFAKFFQVQGELLDRFGGYRCQPMAPFVGAWREEEATYQDRLLMFTIDAPRSNDSLDWFVAYKRRLKRRFQQVEIYRL